MYKPRIAPKPCLSSSKEDSKDPVSVFCRIRPPNSPCDEYCVVPVPPDQPTGTVKLTPPDTSFAFRNGSAKEQLYKFQRVFGENSTQKEVFDEVAKPLLQDLLSGKNGLLFAYGITGSGKTHTMEGSKQDGGLVRRSLDVIFNSIKDYQSKKYVFKPDKMNGFEAQTLSEAQYTAEMMQERLKHSSKLARKIYTRSQKTNGENTSLERIPDTSFIGPIDEDNVYSVFVNYIEIYNKYVYDLLEDFSENNMTKNLPSKFLREDPNGNMYVHGGTEVEVKSAEDAIEILLKGQKQRKVAHTKLNCESSRSHSIFTIRVVQAPLDAQGEEVITDKSAIIGSQLSLVDLAGSERTNRTKSTGDRIKEAGNINNSLMVLRQCIETLRENQIGSTKKRIPYRSDKLTHYLGNYFEGNGGVRMVVCVSPKPEDYDETLPVMKFAELTSVVAIHRPIQSARQDFGLAPGRRRANQIFKEARLRLQEEEGVIHQDLAVVDLSPVYALSSDWPMVDFTPEKFIESAENLKSFLKKRLAAKEKLKADFDQCASRLTQKIGDTEKENLKVRQEIRSYKALYEDSMKNLKYNQIKLMNAEVANDQLQRKFFDFNALHDDYKQVCEERDMAKSQGQLDKQRLKTKLKAKLEADREKLAKDMSNHLKEQKDQLKSQMYATQVKALQNMFDGQQTPGRSFTPRVPNRSDEGINKFSRPTPVKPSRSDPKLNEAVTASASKAGPAVSNRRHRRSLSQGDNVWLDHQPTPVVETGTVLQPNMKRRKSIRRLRSGDLLADKVSHYCLTTQNQDSSGELETKYYKGDVLPTVGGGAQVVFQDVEILRQRDPQNVHLRKRSSDGTPKVDHETLRERCNVGLVGSTPTKGYYYKRPRK